MSMTIWKFRIPVCEKIEILMPLKAKIIFVSAQGPFNAEMWALVDDSVDKEIRRFQLFMTGDILPRSVETDFQYIGTILLDGGNFVSHLFENKL